MRVLICGDRNWTNQLSIAKRLADLPEDTTVINGGCRGADVIARDLAHALGFDVITVLPEWEIYGQAAGPIRNKKMLELKPDLVIAFHSDLTRSKGTASMVSLARTAKTPVEVITS